MGTKLYHAANLPKRKKMGYDVSMCIFCKIASKEIPAEIVYEDSDTMAFLDLHPNHPGHTLVIPKDHFENIYTLPQETLCRMIMTAQKLAIAIKAAVQADGINISINNEPAAGQVVFHSHIHVIPRHMNDNFPLFPQGAYVADEMQKTAEKVRNEIK
jgi:histidine triad (HIT) family protein